MPVSGCRIRIFSQRLLSKCFWGLLLWTYSFNHCLDVPWTSSAHCSRSFLKCFVRQLLLIHLRLEGFSQWGYLTHLNMEVRYFLVLPMGISTSWWAMVEEREILLILLRTKSHFWEKLWGLTLTVHRVSLLSLCVIRWLINFKILCYLFVNLLQLNFHLSLLSSTPFDLHLHKFFLAFHLSYFTWKLWHQY